MPGKTQVTSAHKAYDALREMAMTFRIRPDTRLNEAALAEQLAISRTPLREALNRLVAEGLLVSSGRGFVGRKLAPDVIAQLYEARAEVESSAVRLACERATKDELDDLEKYVLDSAKEREDSGIDRLVSLDVGFHERLALLSRNNEMRRILHNINDRIHFIRWINMEGRRDTTQNEHYSLIQHIRAQDKSAAETLIRSHIILRNDQIMDSVKKAYAQIYTANMQDSDLTVTL